MIPAIVLFGVLLAPPLFLAVWRGKRFEETIAVTTGSMILFMFTCGVLGILKISVYLILGITLILAGASAAVMIRKKQGFRGLTLFFTPAWLAFFLTFLFLLYVHYGRILHEWDEFTHWGDVVKAMSCVDQFSTSPQAHSLFQSYVPGMSLFQYLFEKIAMIFPGGIFTDWRLYFSYHLLAFIFVLPFFTEQRWKKFLPVYVILLCTAASPAFLTESSSYLTTIYIDGFVGLLAGTGFGLLFLRKRDRNTTAHLLVVCSMLVLSKDVGMLFAAAIAIAFAVLEFLESRGAGKAGRKKLLVMLGLAAASIALPKILWEISIRVNHAQVQNREPADLGVIFRVITGQETTYLATIPARVLDKLVTGWIPVLGVYEIAITYPVMTVLVIGSLWAIRKNWPEDDPEGKRRRAAAVWTAVIVLAVYCLGIPVMYMFRFGENSATRLASFDRYMSIVYDCLIVTAFLLYGAGLQVRREKHGKGAAVLLLITLICLQPGALLQYANRQSVTEHYNVQGQHETLVHAMQDLADGEEKHVWIISQESDGFDYWPIRYGIRPCNAEVNVGWSIAANTDRLFEGDHWTLQIPTEEWKEKLKDYDYVLISRVNDSFREDYGSLFENPEEIGDRTIFSVDHERDLLVRVY